MKKLFSLVSAAFLGIALSAQVIAAPVISLTDPAGDDYGPGTYTYPTNAVFYPKAFDMTGFWVADGSDEVTLVIEMASPIANAWSGPNGISAQMFHIYIDDLSSDSEGFTEGIPGANLFFETPWKKAVLCEGGWGTEVEDLMNDRADEGMKKAVYVAHKAKSSANALEISVPKSFIGKPVAGWGFQVAVLGQEGSKESMDGVKVRRILPVNTEWQFGGASDQSVFHPNVLDILLPDGKDQKEVLGGFSVDDEMWAIVPLIYTR